jgi:cellulose synthase/poly-beta-1,6-N-acetylglucosamine synthase-like glycosyltransferase
LVVFVLELFLVLSALPVLATTAVLAMQAAAALALRDRPFPSAAVRPRTVILVPAHNEAAIIAATAAHLKSQMTPLDRLVIVADNCSDRTAELAMQAGAEVVVRNDLTRKGKGFALEAGLYYLSDDPPDVVLIVDADCRLSLGGLDALARACSGAGAPVQCLDLMQISPAGESRSRLAEFAWRIRNDLRPTGYARLGLPCQLYGTGVMLPWSVIDPSDFATDHVAEDLLIGLRCAMKGAPVRFFRSVSVMSEFPMTASGSVLQRRRWLHGHLQIAFRDAPRLLVAAVERRSFVLATLAADLLMPPLVLLAFAVNGIFALTLGFGLIAGIWIPGMLAGMAVALFAAFLIAAWFYCGRDIIGRAELAEVPRHTWRVLRAAVDLLGGKRSSWVRAERAADLLPGSTPTIDSATEAEKCSADRPGASLPRPTSLR